MYAPHMFSVSAAPLLLKRLTRRPRPRRCRRAGQC